MDADRQGQLDTGVEQVASGAQHAALPVLHGIGGAGREDQLAAVTGDVGRDQAHAGLCGSLHTSLDQELQLLMEHAGSVLGEHGVGMTEVHEPDRDVTVLGFDGPALGPSPDRGRHESGQVDVAECRVGGSFGLARRRTPQAQPVTLGLPDTAGRQQIGGRPADHDLARVGGRLHLGHGRRMLSRDDQLALRPTDDEQVERARVHAHRDAQVDTALAGDDGAAAYVAPCACGVPLGMPAWRDQNR